MHRGCDWFFVLIFIDNHWLKNWHAIFKSFTKCSSHNCVATFESHLKTALILSMCDINVV